MTYVDRNEDDVARKNKRMALILGVFAIIVMVASIFYWQGVDLPQ